MLLLISRLEHLLVEQMFYRVFLYLGLKTLFDIEKGIVDEEKNTEFQEKLSGC